MDLVNLGKRHQAIRDGAGSAREPVPIGKQIIQENTSARETTSNGIYDQKYMPISSLDVG
jgi:hypothetical protein